MSFIYLDKLKITTDSIHLSAGYDNSGDAKLFASFPNQQIKLTNYDFYSNPKLFLGIRVRKSILLGNNKYKIGDIYPDYISITNSSNVPLNILIKETTEYFFICIKLLDITNSIINIKKFDLLLNNLYTNHDPLADILSENPQPVNFDDFDIRLKNFQIIMC